MATFTVNDSDYAWSVAAILGRDVASAVAVSADTRKFVVSGFTRDTEFYSVTFEGSFYASATSYTGTVDSITFSVAFDDVITATGLNLDYPDFAEGTLAEFAAEATRGNDLFRITSTLGSYWDLGAGNDTINAGSGDDYIYGGDGTDRYVASDTSGNASFSSSFGLLRIDSAEGSDSLSSVELIEFSNRTFASEIGSASNDSLRGNSLAGSPNDLILGGAGNDILQDMRAQLARRAERARFISVASSPHRIEAMQDHDELMQALRARDAGAAHRVWRRHLLSSGEETCRILKVWEAEREQAQT